jgi:hypothetical protein
MKRIDLQFVKDTLREIAPDLNEKDSAGTYNTAQVVVAALHCGPDIERLATFTRLPRPFIATIRRRMIEAELWTDLGVRSGHWEPAPGILDSTAFWLDVLIAEGMVVRRWEEEVGDYLYRCVEYSPSCASAQIN